MLVRRAEPEEYEEVGRLTEEAYEEFLLGPDDYYRVRLRDAARRDLEAELWVAVDDADRVLGTVTVTHDGSPWREIGRGEEGEFRMLAVSPDAQGQGVGAALVRLCIDRFREVGAPGIVLSTLHAMSPAHRLYERHGFVRVPERDWSPVPGVDLVAYHLDLLP